MKTKRPDKNLMGIRFGSVIFERGFVMFFSDAFNAVVDKVVDWVIPLDTFKFEIDEDI